MKTISTMNEEAGEQVSTLKSKLMMLSKHVYNELPLQQILTLLTVAEHEGITMVDLRKETMQSQPSVSRNVRALSSWTTNSHTDPEVKVQKGLGLLKIELDEQNKHTRALFLTKKGKDIIKKLVTG